ncbi:MAG: nucleotide sugar dehydrogenase [Patescibacteria group bacterium]
MASLKNIIQNKTAKVAIIGQGYVGLPLALLIAKAGFFVWGIDKDKSKILKLKSKISYIDDISDDEITCAIKSKKFNPTDSFDVLSQVDVIIIAVPTPLNEYKIPDLTYIKDATQEIAKRLRPNQLIILESTSYPGTTEEVVLPILIKFQDANSIGENLFIAFSPERVDPGNKKFNTKNTPKVIGGITPKCAQMANLFYSQVIDKTAMVSSAKTAEMTKLLENIFRIVNISLINELALLCGKMDIDIWEVIEAAKTKPFGFMPFYPGPGIGGHCIAVDPFYLSYKAKQYGFFTRFIDLAGEINELMPHYVVTMAATALNYSQAKSLKNSKILILGVSYKKNIKDTRESAALKIAEILHQKGAKLSFFDHYIEKFQIQNPKSKKNPKLQIPKIKALTREGIYAQDLVLILTDHNGINYEQIAKWAKAVVDTRNAVKSREFKNVYRL